MMSLAPTCECSINILYCIDSFRKNVFLIDHCILQVKYEDIFFHEIIIFIYSITTLLKLLFVYESHFCIILCHISIKMPFCKTLTMMMWRIYLCVAAQPKWICAECVEVGKTVMLLLLHCFQGIDAAAAVLSANIDHEMLFTAKNYTKLCLFPNFSMTMKEDRNYLCECHMPHTVVQYPKVVKGMLTCSTVSTLGVLGMPSNNSKQLCFGIFVVGL